MLDEFARSPPTLTYREPTHLPIVSNAHRPARPAPDAPATGCGTSGRRSASPTASGPDARGCRTVRRGRPGRRADPMADCLAGERLPSCAATATRRPPSSPPWPPWGRGRTGRPGPRSSMSWTPAGRPAHLRRSSTALWLAAHRRGPGGRPERHRSSAARARRGVPDGGVLFAGRVGRDTAGWLADHVLLGETVLPGTTLLDLAGHAAGRLGLHHDGAVDPAHATGPTGRRCCRTAGDGGRMGSACTGRRAGGGWTRHASGTLGPGGCCPSVLGDWPPATAEPVRVDYGRLAARATTTVRTAGSGRGVADRRRVVRRGRPGRQPERPVRVAPGPARRGVAPVGAGTARDG